MSRFCALLFSSLLALLGTSGRASAQEGLPDPAFGAGGRFAIAAGGYRVGQQGMVLLTGGQFAVAAARPETQTVLLQVRNADGSLDPVFGPGMEIAASSSAGPVILGTPKLGFDAPNNAILLGFDQRLDDGFGGVAYALRVCRILRNATFDPTFTPSGTCLNVFPPAGQAEFGVALAGIGSYPGAGRGSVYMTGLSLGIPAGSGTDFSRAFLANYIIDQNTVRWRIASTTTGTNFNYSYLGATGVDSLGRMFMVGGGSSPTDSWSVVQEMDVTLAPSPFFGARSVFNPNFVAEGFDSGRAITFVGPGNGRVAVAGEAQRTAAGATDCTVTVYNTNSTHLDLERDVSYAGGVGYARARFSTVPNDSAQCSAIAADSQQRTYVAGTLALATVGGAYFNADIVVARFTAAGALDTTYGPNGQGYVRLNSSDDAIFDVYKLDRAMSIVVLPNNNVIVSGYTEPVSGANVQNTSWWLYGLTGNGSPADVIFRSGFQ